MREFCCGLRCVGTKFFAWCDNNCEFNFCTIDARPYENNVWGLSTYIISDAREKYIFSLPTKNPILLLSNTCQHENNGNVSGEERERAHLFSQIEIEEHMNRYELNIRVHRSFTYTILRSPCEFCSLALLCLCVSIASSNKLSLSADGIASYRFAFQNYFNRFGISDFFSAYAIRSSISIMAHIQHKEWILKWWLL